MQDVKFDRGGVQNYVSPSENVILNKARSITELLSNCPKNQTIGDNLVRAWSIINKNKYKKIMCSISGGSDSDVMLDIVWRCDKDNKVDYVWFDTGLEYQATKDHLKYLEKKYGIEIIRYKAQKPIPVCCKEYGQPFISKQVSECIAALQRHNFEFKDEPYDVLISKYPSISSYIKWWCNVYNPLTSQWNIARNKYLKEFLIQNPPQFLISKKCCDYAKKKVSKDIMLKQHYNLKIMGIRKYEGGIRSVKYKNCYVEDDNIYDTYMPLFWYTNFDKNQYIKCFQVKNSECYTEYGMTRTGCAGCPYERNIHVELNIIQKYEPKLYKAATNIFGDSYEYTRKYREFVAEMKQKEKEEKKLKKQNS